MAGWLGGRPGSALRVLILVATVVACQTTMSLEEAKKVTTSSSGASFVPPPRTIGDMKGLLDLEAHIPVQWMMGGGYIGMPPTSGSAEELGRFYLRRGNIAWNLGRTRQALDDFTKAAEYIKPGSGVLLSATDPSDLGMVILINLGEIHSASGDYRQAIAQWEAAAAHARRLNQPGWLFRVHANRVRVYAMVGDLREAERVIPELERIYLDSARWLGQKPEWVAGHESDFRLARAVVAELHGQLADAERFWRESIGILKPFATSDWLGPRLDEHTARLSLCLLRQGRLVEAEVEVRKALRSALNRSSLHTFDLANWINHLERVLREQGRYAEAARLAKIAISLYERSGSSPESSPTVTLPRRELAAILVAQGRWQDALKEYDTVREQLRDDALYERLAGNDVSLLFSLTKAGRAREAIALLEKALMEAQRVRGDKHGATAELRAVLAMARAAQGDRSRALEDFAAATAILIDTTIDVDDEATTRTERDQRLGWILASYIDLLTAAGSTAAAPPGLDPIAEAFRLGDVARGRFVQRAVDASAARSVAKTAALADLVRREQDAKKEVSALYGMLATASAGWIDTGAFASVGPRVEALQRAREAILRRIVTEFPDYAQLVHAPPITVDKVRAALRPGEVLIATLVAEDKTYVWGVSRNGGVVFQTAPIGEERIAQLVSRVRAGLDIRANTLEDIPTFDVEAAHELYRLLLEPIKVSWHTADTLLIVANGALGQLPFALLPTAPMTLEPDRSPMFSRYRNVPWLVRRYAIANLPSASALTTLRAVRTASPGDRPFVGFGDPYFSAEQAGAAARTTATELAMPRAADGTITGFPMAMRDVIVSPAANVPTSRLAMLPRLPDTAEEIRGIARAMNADLTRDVFLGAAANEHTVKTLDLTRFRVIAFATHGLVPGDLDGLLQPALALTAPEVAKIEGDGLLTMEEILGLRLSADWVVLSACNTANGAGTGAEAISGLGRAFFYAGARALLVTHWPVETRAARALTTELFRRQAGASDLSRARALQATMNWMIDAGGITDPATGKPVFSFAHPIFWAPFALVGDGG